jgi:predicted enzyme related to lactoylglutathione lyase
MVAWSEEELFMEEQFKKHGVFSWCELMTTNPDAAKDFYTKLFGWTTEEMNMMPGMTYTVVKVDGKGIGGIMSLPQQGMPPQWGSYVTVDDVDATARTVPQLGGKVLMGPQDIPNVGRFCVIQDPQGAVISAITYKST